MTIQELGIFHSYTEEWFSATLGEPTAVQQEAWPAIAQGEHTLVSAPTGTGKTLSAFLVFIDKLMEQADRGELKQELNLIYISPLKSLAGDIRENLRRPLVGIASAQATGVKAGPHVPDYSACKDRGEMERLQEDFGFPEDDISIPLQLLGKVDVAIRTGDTPQKERRRMIKTPPHVLITTPESFYLMLSCKSGKKLLSTAHSIIIDELHALIDTKRGAHLMLSIARLDKLCGKPLQRIGLSATIEPLALAAEYLSPEPARIIAPPMQKKIRICIEDPLAFSRRSMKESIWQEIAAKLYEDCKGSRSVVAFVEGRMYAERLAYFINQLGGDGFARAHHGSLSKEQRFEVEHALRSGSLRLLCATSSMELGIDVGEIDQVFQIGCPRTVSSTMQRLGRAGHSPGQTSVMRIFPRADAESLGMLAGDYEHENNIPVRPRILFDRIHDHVEGDAYSRMLAVSTGGTIPDRGMFVAKTEGGVKLGELEEEFVFESRVGDAFLLGTFTWQISSIQKDYVIVRPSARMGARLPFWKGDSKGRRLQTGIAFGELLRMLTKAREAGRLS